MILNAHSEDTKHFVSSEVGGLSQAFLNNFGWVDRNFTSLVKLPGFSSLLFALERLIKPGLSVHYALRKQYIEKCVRDRLDQGIYAQVVVLGCGFDTLALRIHHRYPHVRFFEIDHQALIERKQSVIDKLEGHHHNVSLVKLDPSGSISSTLNNAPDFDIVASTLFVIEGVLMYLRHEEVAALFHELGSVGGDVGTIFTFLQPIGAYAGEDRPLAEKMADVWLAQKGEPYRWSVTPGELHTLCQEVGLGLHDIVCPRDRQSEVGLRLPRHRGAIIPRDEYVADGTFVPKPRPQG